MPSSRPYLLVREQEKRNPVTGLPEQHFYRPTTKEQKAAQNGLLGLFVIGLVVSSPFWLAAIQAWLRGAR